MINGLLHSAYLSLETLISGINVGLKGTEGSQTVVSVIICLHMARVEKGGNPHNLDFHRCSGGISNLTYKKVIQEHDSNRFISTFSIQVQEIT